MTTNEFSKMKQPSDKPFETYLWGDGTFEIYWRGTSARKRRCGILFTPEGEVYFFVSDNEPDLSYLSGTLDQHDVRRLLDGIEQVINGEEEYEYLSISKEADIDVNPQTYNSYD